MLFPTVDFAIFFAVVFVVAWLLNHRARRWQTFMVLASYTFYGWWDYRFVSLLVASTVVNQAGAVAVASAARRSRLRLGQVALMTTIAIDLGLLGWFKYYGFFALNAAHALQHLGLHSPLPVLQVALPVGISFFTFMGLSYVVDVHRGELEPAGWLELATYLSCFPHLVAGPIVRGRELLPQLRRPRDPRGVEVTRAAWLIFGGLFKKVVISSFLAAAIVDPVFGAPVQHSRLEVLVAVYGYAVQIYADFSGYTDIAIGIALLLGLRFPANFDGPYTARSMQDFWRRWHITLSRWLRDYVYVPLGGSRGSTAATCRNVMITMVLGGLWHGAGWTFVAWGSLHGVAQVGGHLRRRWRVDRGLEPEPEASAGRRLLQRVGTFHLVCLGWVFFRADSIGTAVQLFARLGHGGGAPAVKPVVVGTIALGIGSQYVPSRAVGRLQEGLARLRPSLQGAIAGLALLVITTLGPQGVAPFIYYRF